MISWKTIILFLHFGQKFWLIFKCHWPKEPAMLFLYNWANKLEKLERRYFPFNVWCVLFLSESIFAGRFSGADW